MPLVHLIDDDVSAREGLARLLRAAGYEVAAHESAKAFLEAGPPSGPGCLILDVRMPGLTGFDLQELLARQSCRLPVIFITGHGDIPMSVRAIKRGAVDFLPKPVHGPALLDAVAQALEMDRAARQAQAGVDESCRRVELLTARERQVLDLVVRGSPNKQIAASLGIAEPTVKIHRGRVMEKLGAHSVAELVLLAQKAGRLDPAQPTPPSPEPPAW